MVSEIIRTFDSLFMKKMKLTLLFCTTILLSLFVLQSCNDDIELTGDFKETAVVYGLLDRSDSIHMIKITRAFIGPGNSLTIAQNPDSSYFQNVNATIHEVVSGNVTRTWQLFDTIVNTKETDGIFYAPEQKVYAFYSKGMDNSTSPTYQDLRSDARYELEIIINEGTEDEFTVTGETEIVHSISTNTDGSTYQFKFAKNSVNTGEYVNSAITVLTGNSAVVNTRMTIHYSDFIGTDTIPQTIEWNLGEVEVTGSSNTFATVGQVFFDIINTACSAGDPAVFKRNIDGITIKVIAGSGDLYNYILVNQPSSSLAQNKPTYTNLSATGDHPVIGLFASRFTHEVYHPMTSPLSQNIRCIDRNTTMELCIGPITGTHLFCSQQSLDIATGQTFACN